MMIVMVKSKKSKKSKMKRMMCLKRGLVDDDYKKKEGISSLTIHIVHILSHILSKFVYAPNPSQITYHFPPRLFVCSECLPACLPACLGVSECL